MFLNTTASVVNWNADKTECSLVRLTDVMDKHHPLSISCQPAVNIGYHPLTPQVNLPCSAIVFAHRLPSVL